MTTPGSHPPPPRAKVNLLTKLALEMGPLGLFFAANFWPALFRPLLASALPASMLQGPQGGIFAATALFMVGMAVSLLVTWVLYRRLPMMPLVSGVVVLVFGGLTLILENDLFIKLKPTIVNGLFGTVLLGGLAAGRPLLPYVLDSVVALDEEGWRKLTLRWGLFFFFLAAMNEVVWRTQSTDFWVTFKVVGTIPITLLFALAQTPLILRHALPEKAAERQESQI